jgi:hypothetical protein
MATQKNKENMARWVARLNGAVMDASGPEQMKAIGAFMIQKIAVRTRLGYGVKDNLAEKSKLKKLSPKYIEFRKSLKVSKKSKRKTKKKKDISLHESATPARSNLTLTGDMIDSLRIKDIKKGAIRVGPTGFDSQGVSNSSKAFWQEKMGRVFLRLSRQEVKDVRIFWIRQFSDLLKKENLV